MDKQQATEKLKQFYKGHKINRDAFHTETNYIEHHLNWITEQCGGTWDNETAKRLIDLLGISH